jgi:hypothetical protein
MKALILIPCCNSKNESMPVSPFSLPIEGLSDMRNELAAMLRDTPWLINKPENKRTLVEGAGTKTLAMDLYNGRLYQPCRVALTEVASGRHPSVHILIVSAFYGLVRLDEGIKIYELQMSDKLSNGERISEYWQASGLSSILAQYVVRMGINVIWSLLPKIGYHTVFSDFWLTARDKSIDCFRVDIPGVGQASGCLRGKWVNYMIRLNPRYLLRDPDPPLDIPEVSTRPFAYPRC